MKRLITAIFIVGIFILVASPAFAYDLLECETSPGGGNWIPCDWTYMPNPMGESYLINPNCADSEAGTDEQQIAAIQAGTRAWENEGNAYFEFTYGGTTGIYYDSGVWGTWSAMDGNNVVFFAQYSLGSGTLAETMYYWYYANPDRIIECDIAFNDYSYVWQTVGDPTWSQRDIWNIATHELGHVVALGHSLINEATMWWQSSGGDISRRDLHSDDIAGIQAIYGAAPNTNPVLSNGYVTPEEGTNRTTFSYYVDYFDANGNAPSTASVYIDGTPYPMSLYSGTADNGTYRYDHTGLGMGTHNFYFYFEDGNGGNDQLPVIIPDDNYQGPTITRTIVIAPPVPAPPSNVIRP